MNSNGLREFVRVDAVVRGDQRDVVGVMVVEHGSCLHNVDT